MKSIFVRYTLVVLPLVIVGAFVLLIEVVPYALGRTVVEDGPIENATALAFFIAAAGFAAAALRAPMLRGALWYPAVTACWAFLMFFSAGEEISWGQRIFGIETPGYVSRINMQDETNIHNIEAVNEFLGGPFRWMSIYLVMNGLLIPLFAMTKLGRRLFSRLRFPVAPWSYSVLFLGALLYARYYRIWFPIPGLEPPNAPTEIRELLLAVASAFFGMHAALWPRDVFISAKRPSESA